MKGGAAAELARAVWRAREAIAVAHALRTAVALLVALPAARLGARWVGAFAGHEAAWQEGGGVLAMEAWMRAGDEVAMLGASAGAAALLGVALAQIPLGAAIVQARSGVRLGAALGASVGRWGSAVLLAGVAALAAGAWVAGTGPVASWWLGRAGDGPRALGAGAGAALVVLVGPWVAGAWLDAARAALWGSGARDRGAPTETSVFEAASAGWWRLRRQPLRMLGGSLVVSLGLLALAAAVVHAMTWTAAGRGGVGLAVAAGELGALAMVATRVAWWAWLANAHVRHASPEPDAPADSR